MKRTNYILFVFLIILSCKNVHLLETNWLPCPLKWTKIAGGDSVPSDSIQSSLTLPRSGHICRFIDNGLTKGGRCSDGGVALIVQSPSQAINKTSDYEILRNPYGCSLKWETGLASSNFIVSFDLDSSLIVSRGVYKDDVMVGPLINGKLVASLENLNVHETPNFETLMSYSPGLNLEITKMVFLDVVEPSEEVIAVEQIHNNSPSHLVQIISFSQRVFESVRMSNSKFSSKTHGVSLSADVNLGFSKGNVGVGASLGFKWTNGDSDSKVTHHEKETWLEVKREVRVNPYTSLTLCSSLTVANDFKSDYIANGRYSAPGLKGADILAILKEDNKIGRIEGDSVLVKEEGTLEGTLGFQSKFFVVPFGAEKSCTQLLDGRLI